MVKSGTDSDFDDSSETRDFTAHSQQADVDPYTTVFTHAKQDITQNPQAVSGSRFRILRPHARGGLGEVFIAHDRELDREVAFKEIQERHADDVACRTRFLLEAEVTGALEHPGIVPVYGLGHHPDGRPYYAMRFVKGETLKVAIEHYHGVTDPAERSLELRTLLGGFVDVCNAISYAHSRNVLHRDLKPGNIMLGPFGETLVVDWGLAKQMGGRDPVPTIQSNVDTGTVEGSVTINGSAVGTPAFMSPEQAAGDLDKLGPASDVYSLGATLYCILTNHVPFDSRNILELLGKVRHGEFPSPRHIRSDVPRALEAICLKAMSLLPEDRYLTARAVADDIEHWLAGSAVSAYRDWLPVRVWRWGIRRPVRSTLAISCVLFDLIALCVLMSVYIEVALHAQVLPQIRVAMLGVVLSPLAAQVGALLGTAIGALMGTASGRGTRTIRRTAWTGLIAGSGIGLIAMICYLAATTSPSRDISIAASIVKQPPPSTFLALPRAVVAPPNWVGSGVPFDVAAYFAAPPLKENAAPLYIDALMEFYPGMASCFSTDEGRRRGELASERQSGTAAFLKSPETTNPAKLDEHLQQFEVGFLKLSQAQRFRCVFQPGIGIGVALPHCQAVIEVSKVARLRSVRLLQVGQIDRAILDVDCLLHLSRDLRLRGDLTAQLVSVALDHVVCANLIPPILNHHGLQSAHCTRFFSVLDRHRNVAPDLFIEGYRSEYFFVGQSIYDVLLQLSSAERSGTAQMRRKLKLILERSERFGGSSDEIEARLEKVADRLARSTPDAFLAESMHEHNTYFGDLLALAKLPPMERKRQVAMLRSPQFAGRPLIELFPPADNEAFLNALTRHAAQLVATECLIALRLWEFSGKATPVSLTDLVQAAGMSEIPTDPYREDGGMFQLVSIKGNPVVYSIGPDGVDDFGLIDCEFTKKPRGDLLFPLRIDAPIVPPRGSDRNK